MFKEYTQYLAPGSSSTTPSIYGIDISNLSVYVQYPGRNFIRLTMKNGNGYDVQMTEEQFEEFKTNLRTAMRLKAAYE